MRIRIYVTLKQGILDPQGKAVQQSLRTLGFEKVEGVRVGKYLEIDLSEESPEVIDRDIKAMCEKLLTNTVIEEYRYEIVDIAASKTKG